MPLHLSACFVLLPGINEFNFFVNVFLLAAQGVGSEAPVSEHYRRSSDAVTLHCSLMRRCFTVVLLLAASAMDLCLAAQLTRTHDMLC